MFLRIYEDFSYKSSSMKSIFRRSAPLHSRLLDMRLVIANSAQLFTISYPTRAHGIIIKYSDKKKKSASDPLLKIIIFTILISDENNYY